MQKKGTFKWFMPPLWWQFMRSKHNFLLRIAPNSRYKHKEHDQSYYPPPGYGIPPGSLSHNNSFTPQHSYALFLFPGNILFSFLWYSIILPFFIFIPVYRTQISLPFFDFGISAYAVFICVYWLFSYLFYLLLYHHFMPPVLSSVWEKWPVPANHLFLSVPHHVCVREKWTKEDEDIYWQPDVQNDMRRQTSEFAPDTQSLQEILLNFAVFEFFFERPSSEATTLDNRHKLISYENIIKEKSWYYYLFTPIWLNFLMITVSLLILVLLPVYLPDKSPCDMTAKDWIPIANLPYNFIPVIIIWFILSLSYMSKMITSLDHMHKKIRKGFFNAHLEYVPQAILQELSNIPEPEHIDEGMKYIKRILGWISSIALIGFFAILEVLSQAYGNQPITFAIGACPSW